MNKMRHASVAHVELFVSFLANTIVDIMRCQGRADRRHNLRLALLYMRPLIDGILLVFNMNEMRHASFAHVELLVRLLFNKELEF